jgi:2-polyprenyl-3-methyl-5-hydroxy-6-metoxy-1,4-benzoquinol methylase
VTADALGTCPLCGTAGGSVVLEVAYADVWARLQQDWGVTLTERVRSSSAPASTTSLVRCPTCGLERFEPLAPGGPDFYQDLMASLPYAEDRWDFELARGLIKPDEDVVDLGCGEGRFLTSLGPRQGRTVGVDHHEPAIRKMVERGVEAYASSFEAFSEREDGRFDVVTSFHTLEHVADPLVTARSAVRCLRPGGRLLLSVPNRERSWREEGEPLDRPPHHVTRWAPAQLAELARRVGLTVEGVHLEPPDLSVARALRLRTIEERLRPIPAQVRRLVSAVLSRMLVRPGDYEREVAEGGFSDRGIHGHSAVLVARRP